MEPVEASLVIELNVTCPHCEDYLNLFEIDEGRLNDDGHLMKNACPDGYWTETHDNFRETVSCPECGGEVVIKGIAW